MTGRPTAGSILPGSSPGGLEGTRHERSAARNSSSDFDRACFRHSTRSSRRHQGRSRRHGEEGGPPINSEGADKVYAEISGDTVGAAAFIRRDCHVFGLGRPGDETFKTKCLKKGFW